MKIKSIIISFLLIFPIYLPTSFAIITRDDVSDSKYIKLGKKYSDVICHFPTGEGTLIDSMWVITAGHVGSDLKRELKIKSTPEVEINGKKYEVEYVFIHPDFRPILNDLALVKLKIKVPNSRYVKLNMDSNEIGKLIILSGMGDYGTGLTGALKNDKKIRAAENKIDGNDEHWIWFRFDKPGSKNITEMEGISGPGDSGGPAFMEINNVLYIVGISSNQKDEGQQKGTYGVTEYYTRIQKYYGWITSTMNMKAPPNTKLKANIQSSENAFGKLNEYAGVYGIRKIILKDGNLYFKREEEPIIPMKEIEKDLFLWDDDVTKLYFLRSKSNAIVGFEIRRKNGEIIKVDKNN